MSEWEDWDFINHMEGATLLTESKCACGKPVRYETSCGKGSCNKYQRCPTYEELSLYNEKSYRIIQAYSKFTNSIDDYFEYINESEKDRKKVHQLLQNLTEQLVNIEEEQ